MRLYSDIDEEKERIVVTFAESLSLKDIEEMVSTSAKARVLHFPLLVDARNAGFDLLPGDATEFQSLLRRLAAQSPLGQTAVLVRDAHGMAMVNILASLASGLCAVQGFFEREAAEHWLGWLS